MKMIDGAALAASSNNLAQLLLGLAIGRAHDFGAGDVEELRVALIGDGPRQPGLAGAGRAVQQHALGRIDAEPLEQFGMAQRQLDHLAQRVDRVAHAAEVVIGDVGAALAVLLLGEFGQQLDLVSWRRCGRCPCGVVETTVSRTSCSAKAGRVEQLPDMVGHVGIDPLVAGGGDRIALAEAAGRRSCASAPRPSPAAGHCSGRARTRPASRAWTVALCDLDEIARADAGIGALQAVEADDVEACVVAIGADGAGGGRALADDLDDVAFG